MAKIKGIQLKAMKLNFGHDGTGLKGNVYMDNKRIGEILDEGFGGGMEIDIMDTKVDEFKKRVDTYIAQNEIILSPSEHFIEELAKLSWMEKTYKQFVKGGCPILLHMDYRPYNEDGTINWEDAPIPNPPEEFVPCESHDDVKKVLEENKKDVKHKIYESLDDFVIA